MKEGLKTGAKFQSVREILESHTITFEGLPPVLATPFLVWMLEEAAMELILHYLEDDDLTVGTQVDIEHLSVARIGDNVTFSATMIQFEGRDMLFSVQASHEGTLISKGLHRRKLISKSKMIRRLGGS